jgi:hypothetical protein
VAILAALVAIGSRFATKILTTALGWASTLLFGRVPGDRQIALVAITFGSVIWMVLLAGVVFPAVGTFLLLLIPPQGFVPEDVIRVVMVVGALVMPGINGGLVLWLTPPAERAQRGILATVARGYPLTVLLAGLLVFLAGFAIVRRLSSLARGRTDAHVPLIVEPGKYDDVARDLDRAVTAAGLEVAPRAAPSVMSTPARWVTRVAGRDASALVPDHMVQLHGEDLDILIYPMDVLISGRARPVMQARAAMASRLTTSAAHLTAPAETQAIEDRLRDLATASDEDGAAPDMAAAAAELAWIDAALTSTEMSYDDWEVLYRQRLQVERDLRARAMAARPDPAEVAAVAGRTLRQSAGAVLDAATDDATIAGLDRLAGPVWAVGLRVAAASTALALRVIRHRRNGSRGPVERPDPTA